MLKVVIREIRGVAGGEGENSLVKSDMPTGIDTTRFAI
jgi:hypothetical protein